MKITRVATVLEFNAIAGLVKNSKRFIKLTPAGLSIKWCSWPAELAQSADLTEQNDGGSDSYPVAYLYSRGA